VPGLVNPAGPRPILAAPDSASATSSAGFLPALTQSPSSSPGSRAAARVRAPWCPATNPRRSRPPGPRRPRVPRAAPSVRLNSRRNW